MRKSVKFSGLTNWMATSPGCALRAAAASSANNIAAVKNRIRRLFILQFLDNGRNGDYTKVNTLTLMRYCTLVVWPWRRSGRLAPPPESPLDRTQEIFVQEGIRQIIDRVGFIACAQVG